MFNLFKSAPQSLSQDQRDRSLDKTFLESDPHDPRNEAVVTQAVHCHRSGQVKFRGSWWGARCSEGKTLSPGEVVYVLGRHNLLLHVQAAGWSISSDEVAATAMDTSDSQFIPLASQHLLQTSVPHDHN